MRELLIQTNLSIQETPPTLPGGGSGLLAEAITCIPQYTPHIGCHIS